MNSRIQKFLIIFLILLGTNLSSVNAQFTIRNEITSSGTIVYLEPKSKMLYVDGIKIFDFSGTEVFLQGIAIGVNERMKKNGTQSRATSGEETWFTQEDIKEMKIDFKEWIRKGG